MKAFKTLPRLLAVFGLVMMFAASGWGAIAYKSSSYDDATTGNLVVNKPASVAANDVMIASVAVRLDSATITAPTGWSHIRTTTYSNKNKLSTYYKVASNSEPATYTWTMSNSPTYSVVGVVAFSGVDTSSPILTSGGDTDDDSTHSTPSITTTENNAMIVTSHEHHSAKTWTPPTGMTEAVDARSPTRNNGTGIDIEINYAIQASAGASGVKTATAGDSDAGASNIVALRPYVAQTPPLMGDVPNQTVYVGSSFTLNISTYVTLTNGDTISSYTLTGTLPTGLTFNNTTGVISGTPSTVTTATTFSITATDNDGASDADSFTITVNETPTSTDSDGGRDFTERTQHNLFGDVSVIGNTVLCPHDINGTCTESADGVSNASETLYTTSSSANLSLPTDATVKWARLYWQGRMQGDSDWDAANKNSAKTIEMQTPTASFTQLADVSLDTISYTTNPEYPIYSASADVTSMVTSGGSGTYAIQNLFTKAGGSYTDHSSDGLGYYGAWALVVIYEDPNETKARNVTVFDGYKRVTGTDDSASVTVNLSGFMTPKTGTVDSKMYVFAGEGDAYITGDTLQMAGATHNTTLTNYWTDNEFDSRIDITATRAPSLTNNNGIDIHKYDVGTTAGAENIITNNETGAKLKFTTTGDHYFPSLAVFSTQLYLPQLCYDYSIKQDGRYLAVDRQAYPIAQLDSSISSSPLEILVYLKNKEADLDAQGIAIKSDVNNTRFTMTSNMFTSNVNGSSMIDRGAPTSTNPLCDYDKNGNNATSNNGCTNGHDIRKGLGDLGADDYVYFKYKLDPQGVDGIFSDINESLGLSIKYYTVAGGNKIEYPDYALGGQNVPLCPPTGIYQPAWGQFNVVQNGQTSNNINTQIARKPFNVDVIFDGTPSTGTNDQPAATVKSTVMVEMIDVDSFGDVNASCANPDGKVSESIFVPINFPANATAGNYQTQVASQDESYYNFALKNGAYRVWYFTDKDGVLRDWNTTGLSTDKKSITGISGLYNATSHTVCSSSCSITTSLDCFNCMKQNYAKPLCSRDNFSVRPEAFDMRIRDVNQTTDVSLQNISNDNGYSPSVTTPTSNMALSAGYNYAYDINATGNDASSAGYNAIPRYTRYFNANDPSTQDDYNITLYRTWDTTAVSRQGCNDTNDTKLSFFIVDGKKQNQKEHLDQVGEYSLKMIDTSWTAVDQITTNANRTAARGFANRTDCTLGTTNSSVAPYGCNISSSHTNGTLIYKNQNMTFNPHHFDLSTITATTGIRHTNSIVNNQNAWLYMNNILTDSNMSLRYSGQIRAQGENNSTLTNFVDKCFAKTVSLDVNITYPADANSTFRYRFEELNTTAPIVWRDTNGTMSPTSGNTASFSILDINETAFLKNRNGAVDVNLSMNYDRNETRAVNPIQVGLQNFQIKCATPADCQSAAEGIADHLPDANLTTNSNVSFVYGRAHAPRQRVANTTAAVAVTHTANIYYESYCFGVDPTGAACNKNLLPSGAGSRRTDDVRWFVNATHTTNDDGNITNIEQNSTDIRVTDTPVVNIVGATTTDLTYDGGRGYPYITTINMTPSNWLVYNPTIQGITQNQFQIEFYKDQGAWSGEAAAGQKTKNVGGAKTNRRTMW